MDEAKFLSELTKLRSHNCDSVPTIDKRFKDSLLAFGSETEDKVACVESIEYAELEEVSNVVRGLILKEAGYLVSDVLNHAEGSAVPDAVKEQFPEVSQQEWDAVLRLAVLILSAIEKN